MNQNEIGKRIKESRMHSGISQEELAEISQLSSRTIQRIENGETVPRGDSLKRIALALNVDIKDLTTREHLGETLLKEDKWIVRLLIVVSFSFLIYPILGVILPLIFWIIYKDKITDVNETGKRILKFQIVWCIITFTLTIYIAIIKISHWNLPVPANQKSIQIFILISMGINILFCSIMLLGSFLVKKKNELTI